MKPFMAACIIAVIILCHNIAFGWYDETHLAVAKASGYSKWHNATFLPEVIAKRHTDLKVEKCM